MNRKNYNTTELDVETILKKNVFHRDQIAHYFRWAFVGQHLKSNEDIIDFGCGKGSLAKVLWANQMKPKRYLGIDIRESKVITHHGKEIEWFDFEQMDLVLPNQEFPTADKVVSFEVLEHVGKNNVNAFLKNFRSCGTDSSTYYLSTPCYDGSKCAGNHTYDSGDGNGVQCQELSREEVITALDKVGFEIISNYGTFASQKDYKHLLEDKYPGLWDELNGYYYHHVMAILFAPMFPEQSRNNMWILKKK